MSSVLVVGSVAYDTVETATDRQDDLLGGSATYFGAAASFFAPVQVVAVVGEDFHDEELNFLRQRQVDFSGLQRQAGKTFRWGGRYSADFLQRQTLYTHLNVFEQFKPEIPAALQQTRYVFLANIGPELQLDVLAQMQHPRFVAMDTMNYWINHTPKLVRQVLARVDGLIINDEEARMLTGEANLICAMRQICRLGPRVLVVKKGEHGAILLLNDDFFYLPAFPVENLVDPTGAGDTFAGGFMGYLAQADQLDELIFRNALVFASAVGSLCVEGFGLSRLQTATKSEVFQRYRTFQKLTHFELTE